MKKTLITHGIWALAVVAALGWGARREAPGAAADASTADGTSASRTSAFAGDSLADRLAAKVAERSREARERSLLDGLFGGVASANGDLDALSAQAFRDPNPIIRRLAFSRLLEALTPENAGAIREQLVAMGADGDQWRDFHYSWGAIAGKEAFDHAAESPERDMAATMTGWAAANPAEALALLDNLPESMNGQRDELTASVVAGLADSDRTSATDLVLRLGAEGNRRAGNLMEIVANETLRAEGPDGAARWAEALPDGPLKGSAMGRVADAFVRQDPEAAAGWAEKFAAEDYAAPAVARVGERWARSNPLAAVGWLESLPAGSGQSAGLNGAFGDWEDRDPAAASEYLLAMPQSPQRDSAISGFATGYAWQNPELAIEWAGSIQDPALRQRSLTQAGQAYFRRDPDGARAWVENSGLPEEAVRQVLNPRR